METIKTDQITCTQDMNALRVRIKMPWVTDWGKEEPESGKKGKLKIENEEQYRSSYKNYLRREEPDWCNSVINYIFYYLSGRTQPTQHFLAVWTYRCVPVLSRGGNVGCKSWLQKSVRQHSIVRRDCALGESCWRRIQSTFRFWSKNRDSICYSYNTAQKKAWAILFTRHFNHII